MSLLFSDLQLLQFTSTIGLFGHFTGLHRGPCFGHYLCLVMIGHGSFSDCPLLNCVVGHLLHSSILVPYHGWRISHRMHHQNHGNVEHDEAWAPITEGRYKSLDIKVKILRFKMPFPLFAQPIYLWTGTPGKKRSQFNPYSSLFHPDERMYVITSTICWALMVGLIYYLTKLIGLVEMLKIYGVPLMKLKLTLMVEIQDVLIFSHPN